MSTFSPEPAPTANAGPNGDVWVPPSDRPPVSDAPPFTAEGVFNKAGLLGLLAVAVGAVAYAANPPSGLVVVAILAGLGVGIWCSFRPRLAKVLAPVYAVLEGGALGTLSRYYSDRGEHAVTMAVVGTAVIVVGVWFCYRSGLVRVGSRFIRVTMVATLGLIAVALVAWLTGWGMTGLGGFVIFGILYLVIGVMNLFTDFAYTYRAQQAGVTADGEWFAAFMVLVSSVMVYLALLRMLAGRR